MSLFLTRNQKVSPNMRFIVPHREKPWTAKKLETRFPHLKEALDGTSPDAHLYFFYKYNKAERVFEFIDADAEDDFADLLGVKVLCVDCEDEDTPPCTTNGLNAEQLQTHKENLNMIREGLEFLKKS